MSNMSYCRYENTASALGDCLSHWDEQKECPGCDGQGSIELPGDAKPGYKDCEKCGGIGRLSANLSESERYGKDQIIRMAQDILEREGYDVTSPADQKVKS